MVEKEEMLKLLAVIPFFKCFAEAEIEEIIGDRSRVAYYKLGETIIKEGDEDTSFYVILKGQASVTKDTYHSVTINEMSGGSVFGEMSFLGGRRRSVNVVAKSEVIALRFTVGSVATMKLETQKKFHDQCVDLLISRVEQLNGRTLKGLI